MRDAPGGGRCGWPACGSSQAFWPKPNSCPARPAGPRSRPVQACVRPITARSPGPSGSMSVTGRYPPRACPYRDSFLDMDCARPAQRRCPRSTVGVLMTAGSWSPPSHSPRFRCGGPGRRSWRCGPPARREAETLKFEFNAARRAYRPDPRFTDPRAVRQSTWLFAPTRERLPARIRACRLSSRYR